MILRALPISIYHSLRKESGHFLLIPLPKQIQVQALAVMRAWALASSLNKTVIISNLHNGFVMVYERWVAGTWYILVLVQHTGSGLILILYVTALSSNLSQTSDD